MFGLAVDEMSNNELMQEQLKFYAVCPIENLIACRELVKNLLLSEINGARDKAEIVDLDLHWQMIDAIGKFRFGADWIMSV